MYNNQRSCSGFGGFTMNPGIPSVGTGLPSALEPALTAGANILPANTGMYPAANIPPDSNMMPIVSKTKHSGTGKMHSGTVLPPEVTGMSQAGTGMMPVGTGIPAGAGMMPSGNGLSAGPGIPASTQPGVSTQPGWTNMPTTLESPFFTPGFLRTQIGRRMRVEFLIGTNSITDRSGTLVAVGSSYIVLQPFESDDLMMCDLYSIKFVTILL